MDALRLQGGEIRAIGRATVSAGGVVHAIDKVDRMHAVDADEQNVTDMIVIGANGAAAESRVFFTTPPCRWAQASACPGEVKGAALQNLDDWPERLDGADLSRSLTMAGTNDRV